MTFALHIVWYQVLLGLIALGLLFLVFMVISAFCVRIDIRDIPSRKEQNNSSRTITIGFFSDTHGFGCLRSPKWIAGAFRKYNCDLVLFGGDCVHKRTVRNSDRKILSEVSSLLKQNGKTLYAVYGNHDWKLTAEDFSSMGAVLLSDSWEEIGSSDAKMAVCGIMDNERGKRSWGKIPESFSNYEGFRLLLVHNPDFLYTLPDLSSEKDADCPFDYMLAGHLHGGQVHLPGNLEFSIFRHDRIAHEEGIIGGPFTFRGYKGLISNGAGCGFLPIRFMARPEIHILKFHI